MMQTTDPTPDARRFANVKRAIDARRDIFARQGVVVAVRQRYKDRFIGPYFRVGYYERGGVRWIYLGPSKRLADDVRDYLKDLQQPRATKRQLRDLRVRAQLELRRHKSECNAQLQGVNLTLKGFEVRGWSKHS